MECNHQMQYYDGIDDDDDDDDVIYLYEFIGNCTFQ